MFHYFTFIFHNTGQDLLLDFLICYIMKSLLKNNLREPKILYNAVRCSWMVCQLCWNILKFRKITWQFTFSFSKHARNYVIAYFYLQVFFFSVRTCVILCSHEKYSSFDQSMLRYTGNMRSNWTVSTYFVYILYFCFLIIPHKSLTKAAIILCMSLVYTISPRTIPWFKFNWT